MSKDNVKQMFGKMEKDASLKNKYTELMKAHQKDAENKMAEKLIEFGKTSGFAFSKEELLAARLDLIDKINSNKELSNSDLANVAGGVTEHKVFVAVASTLSLGTACAITSAAFETDSPGNCGKFMSTTAAC